jgi:hypothetical protein
MVLASRDSENSRVTSDSPGKRYRFLLLKNNILTNNFVRLELKIIQHSLYFLTTTETAKGGRVGKIENYPDCPSHHPHLKKRRQEGKVKFFVI